MSNDQVEEVKKDVKNFLSTTEVLPGVKTMIDNLMFAIDLLEHDLKNSSSGPSPEANLYKSRFTSLQTEHRKLEKYRDKLVSSLNDSVKAILLAANAIKTNDAANDQISQQSMVIIDEIKNLLGQIQQNQ